MTLYWKTGHILGSSEGGGVPGLYKALKDIIYEAPVDRIYRELKEALYVPNVTKAVATKCQGCHQGHQSQSTLLDTSPELSQGNF